MLSSQTDLFSKSGDMLPQFPSFDLETIPFSRAESFYKIGKVYDDSLGELAITTALNGAITYRWDSNPAWSADFFRIHLYQNGKRVLHSTNVTPWELTLIPNSGVGEVRITFSGTERFLFLTKDVEIHLVSYRDPKALFKQPNGEMGFVLMHAQAMAQLKATENGNIQQEGTHFILNSEDKTKSSEMALWLPRYEKKWGKYLPNYLAEMKQLKTEVDTWMAKKPHMPERFENTGNLAWYLMWDLIIPPYNNFSRKGILMSKRAMNQIWAWDNCINAVSIASGDPDLAWNQLLMFFDKQTDTGMIPDPINDYKQQYGFTKPPIYGWAVMKLVKILGEKASLPYVEQLYAPMAKYTEWWFNFRDADENKLCEYLDGCDSGWDNSTVYDQGYPVEGPDLAAHLSIQMQGLAQMATMLGKDKEAKEWSKRSQEQIDLMIKRCKTADNKLLSPIRGNELSTVKETESLINYIPLELGNRLPKDVQKALIEDIKPGGKFMTPYSLATQNPKDEKYSVDGYWRGPIWSPSSLLIFDGLQKAGEDEIAAEIAERFCNLCAIDNGFYENYNALTGEGLRDKGYSWTAAGFLIMAQCLNEYETRK